MQHCVVMDTALVLLPSLFSCEIYCLRSTLSLKLGLIVNRFPVKDILRDLPHYGRYIYEA